MEPDEMTELENYQQYVAGGTSKHVINTPVEGWWAASGLMCEAAEVLEHYEKGIRKNIPIDRDKILDELGDVFWYMAAVANANDIDLDEVLEHNIDKLNKRVSDAAAK